MKLRPEFITHMTGDQQVMVSVGGNGFHGVVYSNKTAAEIIDLLKQEVTREQLIREMGKKYDAPEAVISDDVDHVLGALRKIGALEE